MMFLLPLFAALLKLFYRRKRMPYMWHFVHAIHLNTVFLILICIPLVPLFAYGLDDLMAAGQTLNTAQLNSLRITLVRCCSTCCSPPSPPCWPPHCCFGCWRWKRKLYK